MATRGAQSILLGKKKLLRVEESNIAFQFLFYRRSAAQFAKKYSGLRDVRIHGRVLFRKMIDFRAMEVNSCISTSFLHLERGRWGQVLGSQWRFRKE